MTIALPRQKQHSDWLARLRSIMVLRPGQRVAHLPGIGVSVSRRAVSSGAAADWWDDNGAISGCVAAYQAKGAASLAASYVNLANPGTYDATVPAGVSAPTWAASTGWGVDSTHRLTTNVVAQGTWTIICRIGSYVEANGVGVFGHVSGLFAVGAYWYGNATYGANGNEDAKSGKAPQDSVLCLAYKKVYVDGVDKGFNLHGNATNKEVFIPDGGTGFLFCMTGNWYAGAIYNVTLSQANIQTIGAAMAAL